MSAPRPVLVTETRSACDMEPHVPQARPEQNTSGIRYGHARSARRRLGPRDQEPPRLGHGQVQLPLPLLHAGGRARVASARRGAHLRGDRAHRRRPGRDGRRRGPADRRRAAHSPRSPRARRDAGADSRRPGPLADDERDPARPARPDRSSTRACAGSTSRSTPSRTRASRRSRGGTHSTAFSPGSKKPSATRSCVRSR